MDVKRNGGKRRRPMAEINVVPLIDVMLVLLIVFMTTAPLMTQGIKVDLPQASAEVVEDEPEETLVVSIDEQGQYFISLGETSAEDPQPVAVETIGENVGKILSANPDVPVYVEADETINYGVVMTLLSTLEGAGAVGVRLITEPPSAAEAL